MRMSEMVPIGEIDNVHALVDILGSRVGSLPMSNIGMPLEAPHKSPSIWNPILEKTERKLTGWKKLYFSKDGRLTLLKSMLSSHPTYYLSLFTIPTYLANKIEKMQSVCTYGHWALGIRKLTTFIKALLGTLARLGRGVHGCGLWRATRMGWEAFSQHTWSEIGVGNKVKL